MLGTGPTTLGRVAPQQRWLLKVTADVAILTLAVVAAYLVRFERVPPPAFRAQMFTILPFMVLARLGAGRLVGMHRTSWRLFGLGEAIRATGAVLVVTGPLLLYRAVVLYIFPEHHPIPLGVIVLEGSFASAGLFAVRVTTRLIDEYLERESVRDRSGAPARRALLVGAGRAGRMTARELKSRPDAGYEPIGFLDDAALRKHQLIEGLPVLGTTAEVATIAARLRADVLVLTMPAAPRAQVREIVERCRSTGLPVQTVPGLYELVSGKVEITKIRPVRIEDLLGRDVVDRDEQVWSLVEAAFANKRILVTGAGGSIGSELCRQLAALNPARLVLFEANENNLFDIDNEMRAVLGDRAVPRLGDVRNASDVESAFEEHRPHVVFHAAAYKHVPMMELHPAAAIDNNVRGTRIVAETARAFEVERFLLVSTDKAVNPTSVMGASKRIAEMLVHSLARRTTSRFCAVRFGNVLGSRGSVLDTFRRQIEKGGPVTVTHPDITRFFMTIPEAVRLLIQACAVGEGAEIFLLEMGEPVRIVDMAREMIRLAGLAENEIPIEFVGLRPGEKLHEELLREGEHATPSNVEGILLARANALEQIDLVPWVARLEQAADEGDFATIRAMLATATGYAGTVKTSPTTQPSTEQVVSGECV